MTRFFLHKWLRYVFFKRHLQKWKKKRESHRKSMKGIVHCPLSPWIFDHTCSRAGLSFFNNLAFSAEPVPKMESRCSYSWLGNIYNIYHKWSFCLENVLLQIFPKFFINDFGLRCFEAMENHSAIEPSRDPICGWVIGAHWVCPTLGGAVQSLSGWFFCTRLGRLGRLGS